MEPSVHLSKRWIKDYAESSPLSWKRKEWASARPVPVSRLTNGRYGRFSHRVFAEKFFRDRLVPRCLWEYRQRVFSKNFVFKTFCFTNRNIVVLYNTLMGKTCFYMRNNVHWKSPPIGTQFKYCAPVLIIDGWSINLFHLISLLYQ